MDRLSFQEATFRRDSGKCVCCGSPAVDAHHIIDRSLFSDGGYSLSNSASVCSDCHFKAEDCTIMPYELYGKCNIKKPLIPKYMEGHSMFDKWGNVCVSGQWAKGPLFYERRHYLSKEHLKRFKGEIFLPNLEFLRSTCFKQAIEGLTFGVEGVAVLSKHGLFGEKGESLKAPKGFSNADAGCFILLFKEDGYKPFLYVCDGVVSDKETFIDACAVFCDWNAWLLPNVLDAYPENKRYKEFLK